MDFGQQDLNTQAPVTFEPSLNTTVATPVFSPLYIILGAFIVLLIAVLYFVRSMLHKQAVSEQTVFLVKLPKNRPEDANTTWTVQQLREEIAKGEGLFTAIGGLQAQHGLKNWLYGRTDHFSFEIVAHAKVIAFYVVAPTEHKSYLEQQLNAIYSDAVVEEVRDYNMFTPQGAIVVATAHTKADNILPLKTYLKHDVDPLNSVINAMSKVAEGEGLAVQYIIRSAAHGWHARSRSVVHKANELGSLSKALGSSFAREALSLASEFGNAGKSKANEQNNLNQPKKLTAMEEEALKGIEEKSSKAGIDVNLRIVASAATEAQARVMLNQVAASFSQYNYYEYGNTLSLSIQKNKDLIRDFIFRRFRSSDSFLLNTEEMASMYHFPLKNAETPNILWLTARQAAAPVNLPTEGTLLGTNTFRGVSQPIKIKGPDRLRHTYIIGKSGTGKSQLMANMAIQDVLDGHGLCMIDPHGDLIEDVLRRVPAERADDVVVFSPSDIERPLSINLLEFDPRYPEQKTFVINEMIGIFDKLYDLKSTGGPIFEQYMRNAMLLIMSDPASGSTLMEIPKVLSDAAFRNLKLSRCTDSTVVDFWRKEAEKAGGDAALANVVPYVTSKLTAFISNDMMRPIIGQQKSSFNLRDIMDSGKILLVSLPKGIVGEMNAYLLGMIIVGKILMAALSRADMQQSDRKDFYLYIDEFQNFTTDSIAQILSEARKYGLGLVIAHQYIGQLSKKGDTTIKDAVFGNVGTMISFKIGSEDAEFMKKEYAPVFNEFDLINVEKFTAYIKLLIDNTTSRPFSLATPWPLAGVDREDMPGKLKHLSRLKYGQPREEVEAAIMERSKISE